MALRLIDNLLTYIDNETKATKVSVTTYNALVSEIRALITEKNCGPILVRLAWHDAGTFCSKSKTGGPRAAQRFESGESTHGANAGLNIARKLLSSLQEKYCNNTYNVTIADLWALAGNTAINVCGGPDIPFRFGRRDISTAAECAPEGRLPDGDKGLDHLRTVFNRMGFNDKDIVVLSGAHTLGACHADRSGFEGPWTSQPLKFDNQYFVDLVNKKWVKSESSKGNPQLKNANDDKDNTMMLTTDYCLFERKETKSLVEQYAKDEKLFFSDFSVAWQKLIQLGYDPSALYTPQ